MDDAEFVEIAQEQCRREDAAARQANRLLICDTNALATTLWHRRYVGGDCPEVERIAGGRKYDLYFLSGNEIPFVQDGLRDGEHIRHQMHEWFVELLQAQATPWVLLTGPHEHRLRTAVEHVDRLLKS